MENAVFTLTISSSATDLINMWISVNAICSDFLVNHLIVFVCIRERLVEMREVYIREAELSPTSAAPTIDCVTANDPFYDRFPWFRLVARSLQYTAPLEHW